MFVLRAFLGVHPLGESSQLFNDPVYARSKHWRMSTSHLTHEMFDAWGWGEVVPDGKAVFVHSAIQQPPVV